MATAKRTEVSISVDAIQFEQAGDALCLCGNSHQEAAEAAWVEAFDKHPGFLGRIDWGKDHRRHDYYIDEIAYDDDGEEVSRVTWWLARRGGHEVLVCEGGGDASPEVIEALRRARDIESAAWDAAWAAADADCGTTDEDRAADDQADCEADQADQADRIAVQIALLPPALAALAVKTLARLAGASRTTRRRAWRKLRAAIGADATAQLKAGFRGCARAN